MNTALLEELVIRRAEHFTNEGISAAEAIDRAGDELMRFMADSGGHGARFCLRMWLQGAKKRISPDRLNESSEMEGDKRPLIRTLPINSKILGKFGFMH
ncbi:hypothetical protein [Maridesulfovibrio zosterae]|uniref:hypothetical protein n=1 Tax=Maridesulfovibrio zosterae TaxID=82171 RepID=UPI00040E3F74|nr:hypothetical protein [Maridesulfovibrio zosterae]